MAYRCSNCGSFFKGVPGQFCKNCGIRFSNYESNRELEGCINLVLLMLFFGAMLGGLGARYVHELFGIFICFPIGMFITYRIYKLVKNYFHKEH